MSTSQQRVCVVLRWSSWHFCMVTRSPSPIQSQIFPQILSPIQSCKFVAITSLPEGIWFRTKLLSNAPINPELCSPVLVLCYCSLLILKQLGKHILFCNHRNSPNTIFQDVQWVGFCFCFHQSIAKLLMINFSLTSFQRHEQSSVFFPTKHQQIDINVYVCDPERYTPTYCVTHKDQKLIKACSNCHHLFCQSCQPDQSKCTAGKDGRGQWDQNTGSALSLP